MMNTALVIQARTGSTRLPDKMILPFDEDKGIFEILLEKITEKYPNYPFFLATTTNENDDILVQIAQKYKVQIYRGSENNVLSRFVAVGSKFGFENLVRICADNPFLEVDHIQQLIEQIAFGEYDYVSYKNENNLPVIKTHLGLFTEAVSLTALQKVQLLTGQSVYLEHVTNYIYEHPEIFKIKLLDLPDYIKNNNGIRLTLDTAEDFELEKELYAKYKNKSVKELVSIIKNDKKILNLMQKQIAQNEK